MKHLVLAKLNKSIPFLWLILCLVSIMFITLSGYLSGLDSNTILKSSLLSVVLVSISIFFILSQQIKVKEYPYPSLIILGSYSLSLLLVLITGGKPELHIWLIGCVLISMLVHINLGYIFTFCTIFFASLVGRLSSEEMIYMLVIGILMCLLSSYMKSLINLLYILIIILSTNIILLFLVHSFILTNVLNINTLISCTMSGFVVFLSFIIYKVYEKEIVTCDNFTDTINSNDNEMKTLNTYVSIVDGQEVKKNNKDYISIDEILKIDFVLMQKLHEHSEELYKKSILVGELSSLAAKKIGADEKLTMAGGFYHSIGRLSKGDYIKEGITIGETYKLPTKVIDIIRQHSLKYEKPKSQEAAIVMLTVSILLTKEYYQKNMPKDATNNAVSMSKIVENVFTMRLTKGSLDECGLSFTQYNQLRNVFLQL